MSPLTECWRKMDLAVTRRAFRLLGRSSSSRLFHDEPPNKLQHLPAITGAQIPYRVPWRIAFSPFLNLFSGRRSELLGNLSTEEFLEATKDAECAVSDALARLDFESLEGLVSDEVIEVLSEKLGSLAPEQRRLIKIDKEQIVNHALVRKELVTTQSGEHVKAEVGTVYLPEGYQKPENEDVEYYVRGFLISHYVFGRRYDEEGSEPWVIQHINHSSLVKTLKDSA